MSITLSSAELEQVARAIELLVSPLDHPSVDDWRSAVNRQLRVLLDADSAGFLLPVQDGLMLYSDEHDPDQLARYPDYPPPPMIDGTPMWEAVARNKVMTLAGAYGEDYDAYTGSAYYNEYAGANGAHDTMTMAVPLGDEGGPESMSILHFWHADPRGRLFGERELAILRMLLPAFRAGVESQQRWEAQREDLTGTLDELDAAVLVTDLTGRPLHRSRRLDEVLAADPESEVLLAELWRSAHDVRAACTRVSGEIFLPGSAVQEIATSTARYRICACLHGRQHAGAGEPLVVAGLERLTALPKSPEELREAFALTAAEARVAQRIARGLSSPEIAEELCISRHTVRRHTERIFFKLGESSRAAVAARLTA